MDAFGNGTARGMFNFEETRGKTRSCWWDILQLAWEHLGIHQKEVKSTDV